ncbi:MAG TPA: RnfABCDGE type electron transport complex subunit D [Pyrinomonadaceae bacterium]|nr:RnfABCDGE type electron transport complex subunit D [Pyrinomonadaceae bacterium]
MSLSPLESGANPPLEVAKPRKVRFDNRYVAPLFITCILLVGHLSYGILESYEKTALAIVAAIITEVILGRIFFGKWLNLASAYITGISVGILVRSPAYWPYLLCSVISIMSKYVLRVKGRHIWNPSNFGIAVLLFLTPETMAILSIQWGNNLLPIAVIWILGSIIIWRARRFHISATYVVSFFLFAFLRSWITGDPWQAEVAPITGPMYQLFVFFMITDPKTTVRSRTGQCVVAFCVALAEFFLRLDQVVYAPIFALFFVGPAANLIEIWLDSRRGATRSHKVSTTVR